jgi:hypothetical protein
MTFIKQTLKNTASLLLAVWIIGSAYAAISTVSSGDPLTADSWNQIVNKFDGIWENSVKEYVDATVSANSGGGWSNCEAHSISPTYNESTITCSSGKSIRNHSYSCVRWWDRIYSLDCWITNLTTTSLTGKGEYTSHTYTAVSNFSASIICCDD